MELIAQHAGSVEDLGYNLAQVIFERAPAKGDLIQNSARDQMKIVRRYAPDAELRVVMHAASALFTLCGDYNFRQADDFELGMEHEAFANYKAGLVFRVPERADDDAEVNGRGLNGFKRYGRERHD